MPKKLFALQSEVTGEGGVEIEVEVEVEVNVKVNSRSKVRRGQTGVDWDDFAVSPFFFFFSPLNCIISVRALLLWCFSFYVSSPPLLRR